MESDDESSSPTFPSLSSLSVGPTKYPADSPSITTLKGPRFTKWLEFSDSSSDSCAIRYQVSLNGKDWFYHHAGSWTKALSSAQYNSASLLNANADTFHQEVGKGTLYLRASLPSDGTTTCSLDEASVKFEKEIKL